MLGSFLNKFCSLATVFLFSFFHTFVSAEIKTDRF
jgi:hypothetical protein